MGLKRTIPTTLLLNSRSSIDTKRRGEYFGPAGLASEKNPLARTSGLLTADPPINSTVGPFRQLSPLPGPRSGHKQFGLDRARRRNEKLPTEASLAPLRGRRCSGKSAQTPTSHARCRKALGSRQDYPRRSDHPRIETSRLPCLPRRSLHECRARRRNTRWFRTFLLRRRTRSNV